MHELAAGLCADAQTVFPGGGSSQASGGRVLAVITFQSAAGGIDLATDKDGSAMEQVLELLLVVILTAARGPMRSLPAPGSV